MYEIKTLYFFDICRYDCFRVTKISPLYVYDIKTKNNMKFMIVVT